LHFLFQEWNTVIKNASIFLTPHSDKYRFKKSEEETKFGDAKIILCDTNEYRKVSKDFDDVITPVRWDVEYEDTPPELCGEKFDMVPI
jgi:hypothetical protein